jgi:GNAT superfamily N-acetyltransferase
MLVRLDAPAFRSVEGLFSGFAFHRGHWGSVLTLAIPGRVFADSHGEPHAALIRPDDGFTYLACRGDLTAFAADCRALFAREAAEKRREYCLELISDDPELESRIADFFGELPFFDVPRLWYRPPEKQPPIPAAPEGAVLCRSREGSELRLVLELAGREAGSARAWTYGGEAEIDIAVAEDLRRRGLGAYLGAEFLRYCADEGLTPRWCCWEDKPESRRLAERLGFSLERTFSVHIHDES